MERYKKLATIIIISSILVGFSLGLFFGKVNDYSFSERRSLAKMPEISLKTVDNGSFMRDFERYTQDHFPWRDTFRGIKAGLSKYALNQLDNNGLYEGKGYISKLEYPLNEDNVYGQAEKINSIIDTYIADSNCTTFLSIIPDKNYFLASSSGHPVIDYEKMVEIMRKNTRVDEYIDIFDTLSLEDYYYTDQHWKQEKLLSVAERIGLLLTGEENGYNELTEIEADVDFYGAYAGQYALHTKADKIHYLINDEIMNCRVTSYDTGKAKESKMYDMDKLSGRDPYEMYLSGSDALLVIENESADSDKELVVFRDSFASSVMPLLTKYYSKITMVDLRYIRQEMLGEFIEFDNQDVLFMYSTLILNSKL